MGPTKNEITQRLACLIQQNVFEGLCGGKQDHVLFVPFQIQNLFNKPISTLVTVIVVVVVVDVVPVIASNNSSHICF